ncbi:hypothetical protein JNUCC31_04305 [Paenibacillus sp. JNUCC31]|uniref:hypothetical protein n=1 Tax=Paenibacillus sp. JNUCC-31 TaxID=2777983 RepID=UPI001784DF1E|nr:hypothetical protein [Paenibacillus sp. JNUCC-31]QOS80169.1 hypothetical protein JNUCC31_04305 [Paenibacillus sp. JNUCC-31]
MEFTEEQQAHIDQMLADSKSTWETEVLTPLMTERNDLLQFKQVEKSDSEKALEQREQELFMKELAIELKVSGLEDFADFFNVANLDELKPKIEALTTILEARKVTNAYVPNEHKQTSTYDQAAAKNDVTGMIGAKLSKLFN